MIVSAPSDYREAARRRLPRFLFDYIDGGAVAENTMNANAAELASVALPGGPRRLPRRDPVHLIHRVGLLD